MPKTKEELKQIPQLYDKINPHVANNSINYEISKTPLPKDAIDALTAYYKKGEDLALTNKKFYESAASLSEIKQRAATEAALNTAVNGTKYTIGVSLPS